jgi:hypothetical protein
MTSPFIEPEQLDKMTIKGELSPGYCEISGLEEVRKFDEQAGVGTSGARVVYMGRGICHFTVKFFLSTQAEWDQWVEFKPILEREPTPGDKKGALEVKHALINDVGITAVYVEELFAPVQEQPGLWVIEVKLVEARSPKFKLAQLDGAEATPNDPLQAKVAAQLLIRQDQINELSRP